MDIRQNPLWLSFPIGRYLRTDVRVSVWLALVAVLLCLNFGLVLGLLIGAILLGSVLVHEFSHVIMARRTGGSGHEILIWPLGGLAQVNAAANYFSEFWTAAAGPLSNGLLCLACLPAVVGAQQLAECLSPLYLPHVNLSANPARAFLLLTFSLNFKLMLINLLPIYPLDLGQIGYSTAKLFWDRQTARMGTLWVSMIGCIVLTIVGWQVKSFEVILLGSVLMMICTYEHLIAQVSRPYDDSFMGYDFSQGYTSLEGSQEREPIRQPGPLERWREQRARKKREKEQLQKQETERRVDELLDKVHQSGMASLTDAERRFLQRASGRYKSPGKE
jgi:Zn-dependent protease